MISIDPTVLGQIQAYQEALKSLEKLGVVYKAIDLHARGRPDAAASNAEVLDGLAKQGRNFVDPDAGDVQRFAQAFADSVIKNMQRALAKVGTKTKTGKTITAEKLALELSGKAYRAAAQEWLKEISRRIESQDWIGDGDSDLSPKYKKRKLAKFGFTKPIGVASGQVLDNVSPKTRNLKLRK